jgi:hypothetical protein
MFPSIDDPNKTPFTPREQSQHTDDDKEEIVEARFEDENPAVSRLFFQKPDQKMLEFF